MLILRIAAGAALLTLGRKLFWLFVAGVGFFVAFELASHYLHEQPDWVIVLIALAVGLVGALIAVFVQGLAIWLAGFIGGGYFALSALGLLGLQDGLIGWVVFFIGGILGGALIVIFFDWALIVLSSIGGATMIAQALEFFGKPLSVVLFIGLTLVGIVFQGILLSGEKRTRRHSSRR